MTRILPRSARRNANANYFDKPVNVDALLKTLEALLGRASTALPACRKEDC